MPAPGSSGPSRAGDAMVLEAAEEAEEEKVVVKEEEGEEEEEAAEEEEEVEVPRKRRSKVSWR